MFDITTSNPEHVFINSSYEVNTFRESGAYERDPQSPIAFVRHPLDFTLTLLLRKIANVPEIESVVLYRDDGLSCYFDPISNNLKIVHFAFICGGQILIVEKFGGGFLYYGSQITHKICELSKEMMS